jgi:hypothetical protein
MPKGWKKSSLFAKVYRWFYVIGKHDMPENLCPYFWSTVFMYFAIIPYTLFSIPVLLINAIIKDEVENPWQRLGFSLLIYFMLFLGWSVLFVPYYYYTWGSVDAVGFWESILIIGHLVWLVGIIAGAYYFVKFLLTMFGKGIKAAAQSIKPSEDAREKSNMLAEFIKAKYNKYCPKIEWEE